MLVPDFEYNPEVCFEEQEEHQYQEQSEKKESWRWCEKILLNRIYADGTRYKFRLKCGNSRHCKKCREDMIDKVVKQLDFTVPLYCHYIDDTRATWDSWRKWFIRNRTACDAYWRYPLKNGWCVVVSTINRYGNAPILSREDSREKVTQWIMERGLHGNVSRSEEYSECSSCHILCPSRLKKCTECGGKTFRRTKDIVPKKNRVVLSSIRMDELAQGRFDDKIGAVGGKNALWDMDRITQEAEDSGMTLENYLNKLAHDALMQSKNT